jgi:hypothetical protein
MDIAQKVDRLIVRVETTHDGVVLVFADGSELELCPQPELVN